ncbi:hypothetical protein KIPB_000693 [Kipferlia bialata]|uniref:Uncharacterized protein n=1 Tax=Kipferlia bialata TaxID=797122 RepID=A0A9K3GF79_9EUKA|nr:hypothetical protein KIPB_000693 [Kipferlia bialata]|eukprot:g693.t1
MTFSWVGLYLWGTCAVFGLSCVVYAASSALLGWANRSQGGAVTKDVRAQNARVRFMLLTLSAAALLFCVQYAFMIGYDLDTSAMPTQMAVYVQLAKPVLNGAYEAMYICLLYHYQSTMQAVFSRGGRGWFTRGVIAACVVLAIGVLVIEGGTAMFMSLLIYAQSEGDTQAEDTYTQLVNELKANHVPLYYSIVGSMAVAFGVTTWQQIRAGHKLKRIGCVRVGSTETRRFSLMFALLSLIGLSLIPLSAYQAVMPDWSVYCAVLLINIMEMSFWVLLFVRPRHITKWMQVVVRGGVSSPHPHLPPEMGRDRNINGPPPRRAVPLTHTAHRSPNMERNSMDPPHMSLDLGV